MARVLIVEDLKETVDILRRLLRQSKHEALVTDNKQDAVRLATTESPAMIFMDIGIPAEPNGLADWMHGVEAISAIRQSGAAVANVPIVALTGHHDKGGERERMIKEAGPSQLIFKPFDFEAIRKVIKEYLDNGAAAS